MPDRKLKEQFTTHLADNMGILHKVCNIYCNDQEEKSDMIQEIALQLWKSFPRYKGKAKFSSWMYRIALNTVISNVRRNKRKPVFEAFTEKHEEELAREGAPETEEDLNRLYKAIAILNDVNRAVIMLYLEENSYAEIGNIIGISEKNVSVRIVRIKAKLQAHMEKLAP